MAGPSKAVPSALLLKEEVSAAAAAAEEALPALLPEVIAAESLSSAVPAGSLAFGLAVAAQVDAWAAGSAEVGSARLDVVASVERAPAVL